MRRIILILMACVLSACNGLAGTTRDGAELDADFVALASGGAPALQVGIIAQNASTLAALQSRRAGFETWRAPDGATLTLHNGLLVAALGVGGDMMGSDVSESLALIRARASGRATRFHTFLDGENRAQRRAYVCDFAVRGPRTLEFGDRSVATQLLAEDCASQTQTFLNLYWIDTSGRIVQSRQWAGDFAGVLTFRIVP